MALFDFMKKKDEFEQIPGLPPLPPLPPEFQQAEEPQMPPIPGMPSQLPPAHDAVAQMRAQGMQNQDIVNSMRAQGYPSTDILSGMQAQQMRQAPPPPIQYPALPPMPAAPPPPTRPVIGPSKEDVVTLLTEDIQQIAESIIEEKWAKAKKDFVDVDKFKEDVDDRLGKIEELISGLQQRMDGLEKSIFGKVEEYGKGMSDVSTELKAMQRVFSTILPQFTSNIKELQGFVDDKKKKKK
ncbi:MAG TPA: hypothetical protein HA224_01130 [Nanoarchaeota archaeon]|nr:hypothetical protein [Nanoarchaeota archaeon]